jgi:Flp pilus assembly protein TadD
MSRSSVDHDKGLRRIAPALGLVLALAACATTGSTPGKPPAKTATQEQPPSKPADPAQMQALIKDDPIAAAAYWGSVHDSNPKDANAVANYGDALRLMGSNEQAITVLDEASKTFPSDGRVLASYGKALAATGHPDDAISILDRAVAADPSNAQTLSAAGVVEDQLGHPDEARTRYEAALKIKPDDRNILSNYGLSRAFAGDLPKAEDLLQRAANLPGASAQIRQNLALVLSLAGKFDEARRVAGRDLLPKEAENNVDYIRDLLGQPARINDADAPQAGSPLRSSEATGAPQTAR